MFWIYYNIQKYINHLKKEFHDSDKETKRCIYLFIFICTIVLNMNTFLNFKESWIYQIHKQIYQIHKQIYKLFKYNYHIYHPHHYLINMH